MENKQRKKMFLIISIIVIVIIGVLLYFYFFKNNISIKSEGLMYANSNNEVSVQSKNNYKYRYSVSDDSIANFASEELVGKNVTNQLIVKSSGDLTIYIQVYNNDKLIKTIKKDIKTCGDISQDYHLNTKYYLKVGEEIKLFPSDDECTKNLKVQIEDDSIVSLLGNNRLLGVRNGSTKAVIGYNDFAFQINIVVGSVDDKNHIAVTGINIKDNDVQMGIGQKKDLNVTVKPNNATNQKINYHSLDEEIVKVSTNGQIEGLKEGKTSVIVTTEEGSFNGEIIVSVTDNKSIKLDLENVTIREGEKVNLKATTIPENLNITWTSSNPEIATVENGVITGKKIGETTIFARYDEEVYATCKVKILENDNDIAIEKMTITPNNIRVNVGYSMTLKLDITPSNATNKSVTWSSSNSNVVSVSDGSIKTLSPGTATITAKSVDGNKTATALVTVIGSSTIIIPTPTINNISVNSISLSPTSSILNSGQTITLTPIISPSNATNKGVNWSSSNTSVATVSNGVVTAKSGGIVVITATTLDGSKKATSTITVRNVLSTINVTGVSTSPTTLNLKVGEKGTITATVTPSNATNKTVTWSSSNPSVATVSNGVVSAVSAGNTTIYVTTVDGNKQAYTNVVVTGSGSTSGGKERLHSINIGQAGNSILLESSGRFGLVDAGGNCSRITSYLSSVGVSKLDFVIVSHMHYDHAECVPQVLQSFSTDKVIIKKYNGYDKGNNWSYYNSIVSSAGSKIDYFSGSSSKTVSLGNMTLKLFNGQERLSSVKGQYSENSNSIVVGVSSKVGSNTMLTYIAGDIQDSNTGVEGSVASTVASAYSNKKFDVYVASHHGYDNANKDSAVGSGSGKIQFRNAIVTNTFEWMCGTSQDCSKPQKLAGIYRIYANLSRNGGNKNIYFSGARSVVVDYTSSGVSISGGQVLACSKSTCGSAASICSTIKSNSSFCSRSPI